MILHDESEMEIFMEEYVLIIIVSVVPNSTPISKNARLPGFFSESGLESGKY